MSAVEVTALYQSSRDGKWYVVVKHGVMVEHEKLHANLLDGPDAVVREAVDRLHRYYSVPVPQAQRMIAAVQS